MSDFDMDEYKKSYEDYLESIMTITVAKTLAVLREMGYVITKPTKHEEES